MKAAGMVSARARAPPGAALDPARLRAPPGRGAHATPAARREREPIACARRRPPPAHNAYARHARRPCCAPHAHAHARARKTIATCLYKRAAAIDHPQLDRSQRCPRLDPPAAAPSRTPEEQGEVGSRCPTPLGLKKGSSAEAPSMAGSASGRALPRGPRRLVGVLSSEYGDTSVSMSSPQRYADERKCSRSGASRLRASHGGWRGRCYKMYHVQVRHAGCMTGARATSHKMQRHDCRKCR